MEEPPLEKIIEKLEKLDIRAWKLEKKIGLECCFSTKASGLTVYILQFTDLERVMYKLEIVNDDRTRRFSYTPYNKQEKDMLKNFYEKVLAGYDKIQGEEWEEMINNFLSE